MTHFSTALEIARRLADQNQELLTTAGALCAAVTRTDVAEVIVEAGIRALRARSGMLAVLCGSGHELQPIPVPGHPSFPRSARIPVADPLPLGDAIRTGRLVIVESLQNRLRHYPDLPVQMQIADTPALVAVPLLLGGRPIGVVSFSFAAPRPISQVDRRLLTELGHLGAMALDRARLHDEETDCNHAEASKERLQVLAEVSRVLSHASSDPSALLGSLTRVVTSTFSDWCTIVLRSADGADLEPVAYHHRDPDAHEALRATLAAEPITSAHGPIGTVARTGEALLVPAADLAAMGAHLTPMRRAWLEHTRLRSLSLVPMFSHGVVIGVVASGRDHDPRPFEPADEILLRELADRAAAAVDHARLYEAERQARAQAEAASRMKDEFLATVSHELRSPLTAILGWAKLLRIKDDPEALRRGLLVIERNAQAQARLIDDVLDVSRIMRGKITLERRPVALSEVAWSVLDVLGPSAETKGVALSCRVLTRDEYASGDPGRLQQVVSNLVSNAIKFTKAGGRIEIEIGARDEEVLLSVRDTGQGIRPDFLPFLFDRFRQADSTTTRHHGGLGLGLAIVRDLVELHGGSVRADSPGEGLGATFTVSLPRVTAPELASSRAETATVPEAPILAGVRVLICEDEGDTRELLAQALSVHGANVRTAESGQKALELLESAPADILVSDLGMPQMDGFTLVRELRRRAPERGGTMRAAALSAYSRPEDVHRALAAGFDEHIAKPVDPSRLVAAIARLVRTDGAAEPAR